MKELCYPIKLVCLKAINVKLTYLHRYNDRVYIAWEINHQSVVAKGSNTSQQITSLFSPTTAGIVHTMYPVQDSEHYIHSSTQGLSAWVLVAWNLQSGYILWSDFCIKILLLSGFSSLIWEGKNVEWDTISAQSQCELNAHKRVMCILVMHMWKITNVCTHVCTNIPSINSVDRPH